MRLLKVSLLLCAAVHVCLMLLLWHVGMSNSRVDFLRIVWFQFGALTLLATAVELSWLLLWCLFCVRPIEQFCVVPRELTDEHRALISKQPVKIALIMPANAEANDPIDADMLVTRLAETCGATMGNCICFPEMILLFDTNPDKGGNEECVAKEHQVVESVRRSLDAALRTKITYREYRNKEAEKRNKPGSIEQFLAEEGDRYDFIMVLDADSIFVQPQEEVPETVSVLDRLIAAMLLEPKIGMIQCAIRISHYGTRLGWLQNVNARLAMNYHGPLNGAVLAPQQPSYGHNVIFRTSALKECYGTGIPQQYLSHDFIEAAVLALKGHWCVHTESVVSEETAEESIDGYLCRDWRWQRGNAQWVQFLRENAGAPIGVWFSLGMGILNYLLPNAATLFLFSSIALLCQEGTIVRATISVEAIVLLGLVGAALAGPKLAAGVGPSEVDRLTIPEFIKAFLYALFVTPPLSLYSGVLFLFAPLSSKNWQVRGSRHEGFTMRKAAQIARRFTPASALGLWMTFLVWPKYSFDFGAIVVLLHTLALAISPITAIVMSIPYAKPSGTHGENR